MKHGEGTLITPTTILKGVWRQDKLDGKTSIAEVGGRMSPEKIRDMGFDQI